MLLQGVLFYGEDFAFHYGDVEMEGGRFVRLALRNDEAPEGCALLLPGLIDIHLHGNSGADFSDGNYDGLVKMARFLAGTGVTSFSPASMTMPEETLATAYRTAVRLRDEAPENAAVIRGVTMEGPFFNAAKKGAQAAENLCLPDANMFYRLQKEADGMIRIVCVAPELEGAGVLIRAVAAEGVRVSVAHTNADYAAAAAGFDAGISHVTHLFNAMPPLLHRAPGVIGAAAERANVTVELICDGVHIHPSVVRAAFKLFGPERICLISDAIAATGLADGGSCLLGGQRVTIQEGRATLADGTIAGSVAMLFGCVKEAVSMGIPLTDALRCATANPARVLGTEDVGVIAVGKRADCLLCGEDLTLQKVYLAGKELQP
ncbi:MAG: N-acetylglucosamine-6-phosphate deacetylase [Eubacteriales bacterium]|nr:N-acetylglucosamine-6-phosphate deacetylase [Eubacteriales bacterium]